MNNTCEGYANLAGASLWESFKKYIWKDIIESASIPVESSVHSLKNVVRESVWVSIRIPVMLSIRNTIKSLNE